MNLYIKLEVLENMTSNWCLLVSNMRSMLLLGVVVAQKQGDSKLLECLICKIICLLRR